MLDWIYTHKLLVCNIAVCYCCLQGRVGLDLHTQVVSVLHCCLLLLFAIAVCYCCLLLLFAIADCYCCLLLLFAIAVCYC